VTNESYLRALRDMDAAIKSANARRPECAAITERNELIELLLAQLAALEGGD
jgi:hypothetical protein